MFKNRSNLVHLEICIKIQYLANCQLTHCGIQLALDKRFAIMWQITVRTKLNHCSTISNEVLSIYFNKVMPFDFESQKWD
jgi:hypothetical protein